MPPKAPQMYAVRWNGEALIDDGETNRRGKILLTGVAPLDKLPIGKHGLLALSWVNGIPMLDCWDKTNHSYTLYLEPGSYTLWVREGGLNLSPAEKFQRTPVEQQALQHAKNEKARQAQMRAVGRRVYDDVSTSMQMCRYGETLSIIGPTDLVNRWRHDGKTTQQAVSSTESKLLIFDATWASFGTEKVVIWQNEQGDVRLPDGLLVELGIYAMARAGRAHELAHSQHLTR